MTEHWSTLRSELEKGTYQPSPVRRVEILKPDGGIRLLGIPTVVDRLIQQEAIAQELTNVFDPSFSDHSYGFRPKRKAIFKKGAAIDNPLWDKSNMLDSVHQSEPFPNTGFPLNTICLLFSILS